LMEAEVPTVIGASRFTQQVLDAPATVTIVTRDEIERYGYRTLADILRAVRGLYVTYDRNYTYLGIRGFARPGDYNSRVLLLVDGHRMNDAIYEMAPIGIDFPLDVDLIERVEVVRGPSSSLYGTSAFFGVINVVTRRGPALGPAVSAAFGSQGTHEVRATGGHGLAGGFDLTASVSHYGSDGVGVVPVGDSGLASVDMDFERASKLFGSVSRGRWTATSAIATRTKGIPTGAYGTSLTETGSQTTDVRGFADVRYQRPVLGASVVWNASYDVYRYDGVYKGDQADDDLVDYGYSQWWGTELAATRRARAHQQTAGTELRYAAQEDQGWYYMATPRTRILDDRRTEYSWAGYVQDELTLSRRAIVSAGVRVDHFSTLGNTANPRLGLILKPGSRSALKVLYGTAFRAPNAFELYYYGDASDRLEPERIRTLELAWEQHLQGPTRVSTSLFRYRLDDLIGQIEDLTNPDGLAYGNTGGASATGVEAEIERNWSQVQVGTSYTFTRAVSTDTGGALSNSPRHMARGRASSPLFGHRLVVGGEWYATGRRTSVTGDVASRFGLASLSISAPSLARGLHLSVNLQNVLDRTYFDPGGEEHPGPILQDGRTARATLSWRF
jgi:outer membrane receptor for ferrienterochelin and colicins